MDIFYPSQETDETAVSVKKIGGSSAPVVLFMVGTGKQGAGRFTALLVNHGLKLVVLWQWWVITLQQKQA